MASVEDLSNSELRTKLAEYGAPVGPVTETTRKVLVKKLKHLIAQRESSANPVNSSKSRKSFSRFSSGEDESEDDVQTVNKNTKMPPPNSNLRSTRRQTVGIPRASEPAIPTPVNKSRRSFQVPPTSPKHPVEEPEKSGRTGRFSSPVSASTTRPSPTLATNSNNVTKRRGSRRVTPSLAEDYDDGSDTDVTVDKGLSNSVTGPSVFLTRLSGIRSTFLSSDQNGEETNYESINSSVDDLLSFRKRYSTPSDSSPPSPETSVPYTSNFARRLTLARDRKPGTTLTETSPRTLELLKLRNRDVVDGGGTASSQENGHFFASQLESSSPYPASKRSHDISDEFKTTEDDVAFWKNSQTVSMILLVVAFVFFLGLGVVYLGVRAKDSAVFFSENERNVFPICPANGETNSQPCIPSTEVEAVMEMMRVLHPRLLERAIAAECGPPLHDGSYVEPVLSEGDAVQYLVDRMELSNRVVKRNLHHLKLMFLKNPHWGVVVTGPYRPAGGREHLEDVGVLIEHGGLRVDNAVLPFGCWARQMLTLALKSVLVIAFGFAVIFAVHKTTSWHNRRREKEKQQVYLLVQQIIELLQAHHHAVGSPGGVGTNKSFLAINHVRDQLIAPQDRNTMSGLWERAVSFLENNESRVRHEVQLIAGEECPVWRWLPTSFAGPPSPAPSPAAGPKTSPPQHHSQLPESILEPFNPNRNKVWQGQAFETEAGSPNNLPCSPTPCLKLRHMFDVDSEYGDDWPVKVQDAILEKCDGVKVLHIAVDKTSNEGCVYVKCTTQEEAGRAYRALHGWWFDSKLVTVKYIRLERYHERFPDAKNARNSLKPSNNKKLSLQASFWQSSLEAN